MPEIDETTFASAVEIALQRANDCRWQGATRALPGAAAAGEGGRSHLAYSADTDFPPEAQVCHTLSTLADAGRPLYVPALEAAMDLRRTRMETMLKVLDVDGAVKSDHVTPVPNWSPRMTKGYFRTSPKPALTCGSLKSGRQASNLRPLYDTGLLNGLHFMLQGHHLDKRPGRRRDGPVYVTSAVILNGAATLPTRLDPAFCLQPRLRHGEQAVLSRQK